MYNLCIIMLGAGQGISLNHGAGAGVGDQVGIVVEGLHILSDGSIAEQVLILWVENR
jgi:hypothetical protein